MQAWQGALRDHEQHEAMDLGPNPVKRHQPWGVGVQNKPLLSQPMRLQYLSLRLHSSFPGTTADSRSQHGDREAGIILPHCTVAEPGLRVACPRSLVAERIPGTREKRGVESFDFWGSDQFWSELYLLPS